MHQAPRRFKATYAAGIGKTRRRPGAQVLEKMRDLYARTQVCLEILERKNNRVAAKLESLSKTKQAVTAYTTRQGHNR